MRLLNYKKKNIIDIAFHYRSFQQIKKLHHNEEEGAGWN
jgi:hypothetical protein